MVSHNVWLHHDHMPDLSRMLCSGVCADVRIHAGREQEPVLTHSLLLTALGGQVVSLMEESNKGDDGYWDIIIPEEATF